MKIDMDPWTQDPQNRDPYLKKYTNYESHEHSNIIVRGTRLSNIQIRLLINPGSRTIISNFPMSRTHKNCGSIV